jgi:hypothetical protein
MQIFDLLFYRGSTKNDEIEDFWFFGIPQFSILSLAPARKFTNLWRQKEEQ